MTIELNGDLIHVELVRSRTRRSTAALRYAPDGTFTLSVPAGCPDEWVRTFLASRQKWMEKTRQEDRQQRKSRAIRSGALIETEFYSLRVETDSTLIYPKYRVSRNTKENTATFHLAPEFFDAANAGKLYANLEKYLLTQMMKAGSPALIARAHYWADLHKIRVQEIFVRVQKSRLGYCTHDDRIMLNGRLLFAPQKIRDYVICHELAHTRHRNHSKQYWAHLEKLFPGARATDKLLRNSAIYSMQVPASPPRKNAPPLLKERGLGGEA